MRFLVDECAGPAVARWLVEHQHEVFSVFDQARGIDDQSLLELANREGWIIITIDKDFGEKIYREGQEHPGIVLLRLNDQRAQRKIERLKALLEQFPDSVADRFVVVTDTQIRFGASPV